MSFTPSPSQDNPNFTILIQQNRSNNFVDVRAYMPESFRAGVSSQWEAPLANGILGMLPGSINGLLRMYGVRPATQAMTLQVWNGTLDMEFALDLAFTTYSDPATDIRDPILKLLSMVTPELGKNGTILSPGPSLDPAAAADLVVGAANMSLGIMSDVSGLVGQLGGSLATLIGGAITGGDYSRKLTDSSSAPLSKGSLPRDHSHSVAKAGEDIQSKIRNPISIRVGNFLNFESVVIKDVTPEFDLSYLDGRTAYPNLVHCTVTFAPLFMITIDDWKSIFITPSDSGSSMVDNFNSIISR